MSINLRLSGASALVPADQFADSHACFTPKELDLCSFVVSFRELPISLYSLFNMVLCGSSQEGGPHFKRCCKSVSRDNDSDCYSSSSYSQTCSDMRKRLKAFRAGVCNEYKVHRLCFQTA